MFRKSLLLGALLACGLAITSCEFEVPAGAKLDAALDTRLLGAWTCPEDADNLLGSGTSKFLVKPGKSPTELAVSSYGMGLVACPLDVPYPGVVELKLVSTEKDGKLEPVTQAAYSVVVFRWQGEGFSMKRLNRPDNAEYPNSDKLRSYLLEALKAVDWSGAKNEADERYWTTKRMVREKIPGVVAAPAEPQFKAAFSKFRELNCTAGKLHAVEINTAGTFETIGGVRYAGFRVTVDGSSGKDLAVGVYPMAPLPGWEVMTHEGVCLPVAEGNQDTRAIRIDRRDCLFQWRVMGYPETASRTFLIYAPVTDDKPIKVGLRAGFGEIISANGEHGESLQPTLGMSGEWEKQLESDGAEITLHLIAMRELDDLAERQLLLKREGELKKKIAGGDVGANVDLGKNHMAAALIERRSKLRSEPVIELLEESAREAFQAAAEKGIAEGAYQLAILWAIGRGGPTDMPKAREFMEKAAALGHPKAQERLKEMVEEQKTPSKEPTSVFGAPVLDKFEAIEAEAPDPSDLGAYKERYAALGLKIDDALAKNDIRTFTDLSCERLMLGWYYGKATEDLGKIADVLRNKHREMLENEKTRTDLNWCVSTHQYYRGLVFSMAGWVTAYDEIKGVTFGVLAPKYPKFPEMQVKHHQGQAYAISSMNGLKMTENRGGKAVPYQVEGQLSLKPEDEILKAVETEPNSPRVRSVMSLFAAEAGDVAQAIREADTAVALCPKSATYLARRAYVKYTCGLPFEECNKDWEASLALRKNNPLVRFDRGMCLLAREDIDGAMKDFEAGLAGYDPKDNTSAACPAIAWILNARGELRKAQGNTKDALEDFKLAAAVGPRGTWTEAVSYKAGVRLAELGEFEEAARYFQGARSMYCTDMQADERAKIALESVERKQWPPQVRSGKATQEEIALGFAAAALFLIFEADMENAEAIRSGGKLSSSDMSALAQISDDSERERERLRLEQKRSRDFQQHLKQQQWRNSMSNYHSRPMNRPGIRRR